MRLLREEGGFPVSPEDHLPPPISERGEKLGEQKTKDEEDHKNIAFQVTKCTNLYAVITAGD